MIGTMSDDDAEARGRRGDWIALTLARASALLLGLLDNVLDSAEATLLRGIGIGVGVGVGGCNDRCRWGEARAWSRLTVCYLLEGLVTSVVGARASPNTVASWAYI